MWYSVPWYVAVHCQGVLPRKIDSLIRPSDPRTYIVNKGWRVQYREEYIRFGSAIVCDGSIHHGGHEGDDLTMNHALHLANDSA